MYACPDHPSIQSPNDGKCPLCNRSLLLVSLKNTKQAWLAQWQPVWVIASVIFTIVFASSWQAAVFLPMFFIANSIAGLLIASSTSMLLQPKAFLSLYSKQATATTPTANEYLLPVIELLLAIGYIAFPTLQLLLVTTWIILTITSVLLWIHRTNTVATIGVMDSHKIRTVMLAKNMLVFGLTVLLFL